MKHLFYLSLLLASIFLSSCMKKYTCDCFTESKYMGGSTTTNSSTTLKERSREDARVSCEGGNSHVVSWNMEVTVDCHLR